jgi:hypothetical protein
MSIREFVSIVRNNLDSITTDSYISSEYIYNVAISIAKLFTKRESDNRKIFKNTSMFKYIDCIKMKSSSVSDCADLDLPCKSIMKSVDKIPEIYLSNYGSLIIVRNITGDKIYNEINPISYKNTAGQKYAAKTTGFFWIRDNYIIIPDSEVEQISIMFLSPSVLDSASDESGCSILDKTFPVLDYLLFNVIEATTKQIALSKQIIRDENTNLNETK